TLIFKVIDTGIGIPAEDQHLLFEPFVQSKTMRGTHTGNSGTGLGLAIVKRMLEKMGGAIELESEVGKGSTFTVTLRHVAYCANPAKLPDSSNGVEGKASELSDLQVLIVDDVQLNLMVLGAMLGKLGITPYVAGGGAEALNVLDEHRIDLVLSDLWMPEMNGAELADRIRRGPGGDRIFLAAVTADVESSDSFDMTAFDTILTKPVTLEKLRRLCEEIHAAHCFAANHS
ncbi:MAG: ATP-binding protein, partial [Victivallaceae bacterium]